MKFEDVFRVLRAADGQGDGVPHIQISFPRGILVDARTQEFAKSVGELSVEDDPTRWVRKDGSYVLKEGGFEFL